MLFIFTLSRELVFSGMLFPESVLIREPRESAWRTEPMLGVEVWGEATHRINFIHIMKSFTETSPANLTTAGRWKAWVAGRFWFAHYSPVPEMTPNTSLWRLLSRLPTGFWGVTVEMLGRCSSRPFWGDGIWNVRFAQIVNNRLIRKSRRWFTWLVLKLDVSLTFSLWTFSCSNPNKGR